jgi:hypothetical protein
VPARAAASRTAAPATTRLAIAATDRPACAQLYARLLRATQAINASSELIASSVDKQQLSQRIATEANQLSQAAELMSEGATPAPLIPADREIAAALRAFSADFKQAEEPAARGDFQGAVEVMGDKPVVQRIVDASTTIENACK